MALLKNVVPEISSIADHAHLAAENAALKALCKVLDEALGECIVTFNLIEQFVPDQVAQRGIPISFKGVVPRAVKIALAARKGSR